MEITRRMIIEDVVTITAVSQNRKGYGEIPLGAFHLPPLFMVICPKTV